MKYREQRRRLLTGDDGGDVPDTAVTGADIHVGHCIDWGELKTWTGHCHIAQVADVHREWAVCVRDNHHRYRLHVGLVSVIHLHKQYVCGCIVNVNVMQGDCI